jgi:hypothetical protein
MFMIVQSSLPDLLLTAYKSSTSSHSSLHPWRLSRSCVCPKYWHTARIPHDAEPKRASSINSGKVILNSLEEICDISVQLHISVKSSEATSCQLWTEDQCFRDYIHPHHEGNDVKVDCFRSLYTWSEFPLMWLLANGE